MAISQELQSIKSAGTYRREYDLSNMQPAYESTYSRGRLVAGFSYQGPFNKPFRITDSTMFTDIFGNIDPKLEANGDFFHRTALDMLKGGPIIALNLHSYKESAKGANIAEGTAIGTRYANTFNAGIKNIFSTSLWYEPWPDRLKDTIDSIIDESNSRLLCDFAPVDGDVVWDKTEEEAGASHYMNYVFMSNDGDTTNLNACNAVISGASAIGKISLRKVTDGVIDENVTPFDILIYSEDTYKEASIAYTISSAASAAKYAAKIEIDGDDIKVIYTDEEDPSSTETACITFDIIKLLSSTGSLGNRIVKDPASSEVLASDSTETGKEFIYLANASGNDIRAYVYKTPKDTSDMLAYDIPLSDYYGNDIPYELQEYLDENDMDPKDYTLADFMFTLVIFNDVKTLSNDMIAQLKTWGFPNATDLTYIRQDDALFDLNGIDGVLTYTGSSVPGMTNASGTDISLDTYLRSIATSNYIIGFTKPYCEKSPETKTIKPVLETIRLEKVSFGVEPYAKNEDNYKAILHTLRDPSLDKIKYNVSTKNAKTGKWNDEKETGYYGVTNMWNAITDRMVLSFRHLVDCWGYGLESDSKSIFSKICMYQHATGFLNAPSALTISKVDSLVDDFGCINYKKLATLDDIFSVPNIKDGASYIGYFYPWNRNNNKLLPPAGVVSNLFISKQNPWDVAAGTVNGVLNGYNPECPLSSADRAWLEALGINAIINANDDQQTVCVYGNKTAKQKPVSALSALNFRDFVVYIMDEIENIIKPYVFKENTESVRTEIVAKCNTFLKSVTATPERSGGLTAFEVTMNSTNNTPEIIDNFYGVLDIKIEGSRPMEKIVDRLYILPTGALTTVTA